SSICGVGHRSVNAVRSRRTIHREKVSQGAGTMSVGSIGTLTGTMTAVEDSSAGSGTINGTSFGSVGTTGTIGGGSLTGVNVTGTMAGTMVAEGAGRKRDVWIGVHTGTSMAVYG